ncbi:MAG: hypothetical protein SO049_00590, partial [Prevotella sp.]|nr:hypothetical protein [Prevotella sp.]
RLVKPEIPENTGSTVNLRPELKTIDAQLRLADAKEKALDATLMPRLGIFAQGYYGYPGYNMFEDMTALQILSVDSPRKSVSQISSCNGTLFKIIV